MAEQVLSDLYMIDGGAEDADAVLSDNNTTTFKMNKNLLMGLQVFLVILLIFLLFLQFFHFIFPNFKNIF